MFEEPRPAVGQWYRGATGEAFEVVALDEDEGTAEIQYFDGALEEIDGDIWSEYGVQPVAPPEDWSGSLDIVLEDYGVDLERVRPDDWRDPQEMLER